MGPHFAPVEFADEGKQAPGGGVDVGGQGGDRGGKRIVVQMREFIRNRRLEGRHEYATSKWRLESEL